MLSIDSLLDKVHPGTGKTIVFRICILIRVGSARCALRQQTVIDQYSLYMTGVGRDINFMLHSMVNGADGDRSLPCHQI